MINKDNEFTILDIEGFTLDDFTDDIYDCETDGSCGNGHIHTIM